MFSDMDDPNVSRLKELESENAKPKRRKQRAPELGRRDHSGSVTCPSRNSGRRSRLDPESAFLTQGIGCSDQLTTERQVINALPHDASHQANGRIGRVVRTVPPTACEAQQPFRWLLARFIERPQLAYCVEKLPLFLVLW